MRKTYLDRDKQIELEFDAKLKDILGKRDDEMQEFINSKNFNYIVEDWEMEEHLILSTKDKKYYISILLSEVYGRNGRKSFKNPPLFITGELEFWSTKLEDLKTIIGYWKNKYEEVQR